jgi:CheY-like chemotaxis protein
MPPSSPAAGPAVSRRVLIVEDNADSRETLKMVLEGWGHDVEVAGDGAAGLDKAKSWGPEIAVVDIGLPVIDGYEFARRVRCSLATPIYLIALTGYCQPEDRRRALEAGFDSYFTKPADLEKLSHLIAKGA